MQNLYYDLFSQLTIYQGHFGRDQVVIKLFQCITKLKERERETSLNDFAKQCNKNIRSKRLLKRGAGSLAASVTRLGDLLDFGNFLKPLAIIILPKSPTLLGNFCKLVKIYHFSSLIIFGPLLQTFGDFFLVTLLSWEKLKLLNFFALEICFICVRNSFFCCQHKFVHYIIIEIFCVIAYDKFHIMQKTTI